MASANESIALSAALVMGLASSAHCFGMCGGLAGAFGMRFRNADNSLRLFGHTLIQQIARIVGYAIFGALCGAAGATLQSVLNLVRIGQYFRIVSGALLLLIAIRLLVQWNALAPVEQMGARVWKKLQPLTMRLPSNDLARTVAFGLIWGLLPCGMVYSMLAFAALSSSALNGALLMTTFGLGTLPAMLASVFAAAKATRPIGSLWMQRASGALLIGFGVWFILSPLLSQHPGHIH